LANKISDLIWKKRREEGRQREGKRGREGMEPHFLGQVYALEKVAVAVHHLHLSTLLILPSHSGTAYALGHLNSPQRCSWQI